MPKVKLEVGPHRLLDGFQSLPQFRDRDEWGRGALHSVLEYDHESGDERAEVYVAQLSRPSVGPRLGLMGTSGLNRRWSIAP